MSPSRVWKARAEELCFAFRDRSYTHGEPDIHKGILPKHSCYFKCQCSSTRSYWNDQLLVPLFSVSSIHTQQNWCAERAEQLLTGAQYLGKQSKSFLTLPTSECENLLVAPTLNFLHIFQKERKYFLLREWNLFKFTPSSNRWNAKHSIHMQHVDAVLKDKFLHIFWGPRELPHPGFEGTIACHRQKCRASAAGWRPQHENSPETARNTLLPFPTLSSWNFLNFPPSRARHRKYIIHRVRTVTKLELKS